MAGPVTTRKAFDRSIVEGPLRPAVWRLAWPTMLQNVIAGLQGIIDHAMVGHFVGYTGNAAIGVSWQIIIVVIVFAVSVFTGMGVLVARFAGANEPDKVNRVVYQAFLTAAGLSVLLGAVGWAAAPALLDLVNAAPDVHAEALPFLRTMMVGFVGMMMFFMLSGAFRAAGDPHTPLRLGVGLTVLTIGFNLVLIPTLGTVGAAYGTIASSTLVSSYGIWRLMRPESVIHFERHMDLRPDFTIIRSLFRFGLPTGVQGIAMNVGGVLLLRFIGSLDESAEAQAAYTIGYTELFSFITWTSVGLMGAASTIAGQNLGAGNPDRAIAGVRVASQFDLRHGRSARHRYQRAAPAISERVGILHHRRAELYGRAARHRRHAKPSVYFDRVADHRASGPVHVLPGDNRSRGRSHLDGDSHGARPSLRFERRAVPAAEVAHHCRRYRAVEATPGYGRGGNALRTAHPDARRARPGTAVLKRTIAS
jgi:putative MATE family efflux protein